MFERVRLEGMMHQYRQSMLGSGSAGKMKRDEGESEDE